VVANIHSQEENTLIRGLTNGEIWIGFTDEAEEGKFVWSDGITSEYTNWNGGEPNNWGNNENCTTMKGSGKWNDLSCNNQRRFICYRGDPEDAAKNAEK